VKAGYRIDRDQIMDADRLGDEETVYRAILRRDWIDRDSNQVKPQAFLLRPAKDNDGLSVYRSKRIQLNEIPTLFNRCYGVCELRVEDIRSLGLDVVTSPGGNPQHALVVGLPTLDEDPEQALVLAVELAKKARLCTR